jgi:hypothetical protein
MSGLLAKASEAARKRLAEEPETCHDIPCRMAPCWCMEIATMAAIEAMRDPTEEMCDAANGTGCVFSSENLPAEPERVWRAMIDAALGNGN